MASFAHRGAVALGIVGTAIATLDIGCRSDSRDYFVLPFEAGSDAGAVTEGDAGPDFDPTIGGPCTEDAQCDDLVPCTFDRCDLAISRCRNTPDDTQCDDKQYCNGLEVCKLREGCVRGPVVTCGDGNGCSIDRCVEATRSCEHVPRDTDGDGDPDDHCSPHRDCDDTDPTVSSTRTEICGNHKDDNCNGEIDEPGCHVGANDVCATALEVTAAGTYLLESVAAEKNYTTSCSVRAPSAAHDIVVAINVPASASKDVVVRAVTDSPRDDVAVALQTTCGDAASETSCGYVRDAGDAWAVARNVAGGTKVYAVITTQSECNVDVRVDFLPASLEKPTNESCADPMAVATNQAFEVALIDPVKDLASECGSFAGTGELTYAFDLPAERDVEIYASTLVGSGFPVVSMRWTTCTNELSCRVGTRPPLFARKMSAGRHVFSVAGTSQIRASVLVKTSTPTDAPDDQTCTDPPKAPVNASLEVDLSGHEDAIKNGCFPGGPNAAYAFTLGAPSDVLVVGRLDASDRGGVSINAPACTAGDSLECATGAGPLRVSRRNLAAGDYRVVVADQLAMKTDLLLLVRPTVAPTIVTADTCSDATVIPESGGFFTGNTASATANLSASCDAPGQPINGARDQQLRLTLSQRKRVVFDMLGSTMATVLNLRSGDPCPGVEVPNACAAGADAGRSFLDQVLEAGTYWVQVDGYGGASGPWYLDVRVLDP